jgi:hypothetical protein
MASFQAPPGHLSQAEVLILSRMVEAKLNVEAPDPDLKVGIGPNTGRDRLPPRWVLHAASAGYAAPPRRALRPFPFPPESFALLPAPTWPPPGAAADNG